MEYWSGKAAPTFTGLYLGNLHQIRSLEIAVLDEHLALRVVKEDVLQGGLFLGWLLLLEDQLALGIIIRLFCFDNLPVFDIIILLLVWLARTVV